MSDSSYSVIPSDESLFGAEPNTISIRREIPVRDYNDNAPMFIGRPYSSTISEASSLKYHQM